MRKWVLAGMGAAAVTTAAVLVVPTLVKARPVKQDARTADEGPRATQLNMAQVVLFSSGVGYFQREGVVEGAARVDLSFPVTDVNDLIKSMVLRDADGGTVSAVSIDSSAPTERTLRSFAINLTNNPSFTDILNQARGEKVQVVLSNAGAGAAGTLSGTIVGVEKQKQTAGKEVVEVQVLNLWCVDGMRSVKLADVQRVQFLNALIDAEVRKALETLALSHDTQKKAVSLRFVGEGKRRVKVGYVVENPIWKTSYRLVLGTKEDEKPYLQGWAVVENPTDEDWKDVRMALVSGRPISFQMDLYQPLYVQRPTVALELFQSLNPVAYSGSMEESERMMARTRDKADKDLSYAPPAPTAATSQGVRAASNGKGAGYGFGGVGGVGGPVGERWAGQMQKRMNLGRSVASAASAGKLGDFFQYAIEKPVTLPRQKTALLPIVGKDVQARRVSIYNERTQAKFPLLGLRFKNTSGLHLMQGPITVFEGSTYAGDAKVFDVQPDEERLISYAIDLGTEVNPIPSSDSGRILSLKAIKGIVETTVKNRQIKTYQVKNRNPQERTVLIEHPVNHAFHLTGAKPKETASDFYRFELTVPAGETKKLEVVEEREDRVSYQLKSIGDEQIRWLLSQPTASKKMQEGMKKAMALRWEASKSHSDLEQEQRLLDEILKDQTRIRENFGKLDKGDELRKLYLKKLTAQETQIEKHREDIKKLQEKEHEQTKAFDAFLAAFSTE